MVVKEVIDEVYLAKVIYVCNCSCKRLSKFLADKLAFNEHLEWDEAVGGTAFLKSPDDSEAPIFLIWVKDKKDIGTLLHELVHLVNQIFTYKGIPFTSKNDDAIAYYLEYWFCKLTDRTPNRIKKGGNKNGQNK